MTEIKLPPLPNDSETPASSEWQWSDADMQAYATAAIEADRQARGEPVAIRPVDHTPPYDNCTFRLCDLPGQCRSEGKCHHPARPAAIEADRKQTVDLISVYQEKIRALEAENYSLVSDLDDRQARGEPVLYQSRTRPIWVGASKNWTAWENCTRDQANDYKRVKVLHDWEYEVRELYTAPQPQQPRPTDDDLWDKTLRDRDHYHDMADKLAEAIAAHFGVDIGEHSSANCPWEVALEAIESAQQIPEGYRLCLIPKEGTPAFNAACSVADQESLSGTGPCGVFIAGVRAMLEAAPEPEGKP